MLFLFFFFYYEAKFFAKDKSTNGGNDGNSK